MSLDFDDRVKTGNVHSVWWVVLRNDTFSGSSTATNTFRIATSEFVDTQSVPPLEFYHYPIIKNKPSIRTSIDLAKSTAKTSDVTLTCINEYLPSKYLSEELLYNGSTHYINQTVTIYQAFLGDTSGDETQIYTGRLVDISHDHETCTLKIQSARPWDFISIPNKKSENNNLFPIAYGDYSANTTDYCSDKKLFPIPIDSFKGTSLYSLSLYEQPTTGTGASSPNPHFFDKNYKIFVPLYEDTSDSADNETTDINGSGTGGYSLTSFYKLKRKFTFKPVGVSSAGGWTDSSNSYDSQFADDSSTFAYITHEGESAGTTTNSYLYLTLPQVSGKITSLKIKFKFQLFAGFYNGTGSFSTSFSNISMGVSDTFWSKNNYTAGSSYTSSVFSNTSAELVSNYESNGGLGDIKIKVSTARGGVLMGTWSATYRIYDVRVVVTCEVDYDETTNKNLQSGLKIIEDVEELYSGGDGLDMSYGSGTAITIPEVHRDILKRYAGIHKTSPDGWSDLNSNRSNWKCRYWLTEPEDLQKVLEKLQYEGGFIFTFTASGRMRYIYMGTSFSADSTFGDNDLSRVQISHTPFSSLLTKWNINYEKHPAENKYITEVEKTNSTSRDKWNIQDDENIKEVKLDALVDSTGVDEFYTHYDKIHGDIKIIVSGEIINPAKWGVEVGDIVDFSTSLEPYGGTWSGKYFMITDVTRKIDSVSIKCREVS